MTRVVNLRREPYDVYIGREGHGEDGYFGNPFRVGAVCKRCRQLHPTAESLLPCFREYFNARLGSDPEFYWRVWELRGKTLGCFCKPGACHGDVIVEYLEGGGHG